MDDIKERIKVKEFLNWIKSTLGLEQTKKALEDYVELKFKLYTDGKAKLCHGQLLTPDEVTHMRVWFCSQLFIDALEYKREKWTWIGTGVCECESTFEKVLSLYIKEPNSKGINVCWKNSVEKTPTSLEWKIAKVFMPMGNETNKGPKDTDPYAMFQLMKQCDLFHNCIRSNHLKEAKKIRNNLFHSSENLVTDDNQKEYFDTLIAVLTDASNDTEVPQATRGQITDDIAKMKKLQNSDISMTLFDDLEAALRIKRAGIYYDFEKSLCENDPEKLREVLKLVEQIGGDLEHLKKHLHELKNFEKYKKEIDELQKQRDNVKAVVEKIPSAVRSIEEQNNQLRAAVNVMQTECRGHANEIQTSILRKLANVPSTEKMTQLKNKVNVLSAEHMKFKEAFHGLQQFDIIKAKMGDWKRNLRREISQVESEGIIIVVIVTVVLSVLFRILLFLD